MRISLSFIDIDQHKTNFIILPFRFRKCYPFFKFVFTLFNSVSSVMSILKLPQCILANDASYLFFDCARYEYEFDNVQKLLTIRSLNFANKLKKFMNASKKSIYYVNIANKFILKINMRAFVDKATNSKKKYQFKKNLGCLQKNETTLVINESDVCEQKRWLQRYDENKILKPLSDNMNYWFFFWDIESYSKLQNPWAISFYLVSHCEFDARTDGKVGPSNDVFWLKKFDEILLKKFKQNGFLEHEYLLTNLKIGHLNQNNSRSICFLKDIDKFEFFDNILLFLYIRTITRWFTFVSKQINVQIVGYAYNSGKYDSVLTAQFYFNDKKKKQIVSRYIQKNRRIYEIVLNRGLSNFFWRDLILLLPPLGESFALKKVAKILNLKHQKIDTFSFDFQDAMLEQYQNYQNNCHKYPNSFFVTIFSKFLLEALEYNVFDCLVLKDVAEWVGDICAPYFCSPSHVLIRNLTLGQIAMTQFKLFFLGEYHFVSSSIIIESFFRRSIYGARCLSSVMGAGEVVGWIICLDLCSMYPSALTWKVPHGKFYKLSLDDVSSINLLLKTKAFYFWKQRPFFVKCRVWKKPRPDLDPVNLCYPCVPFRSREDELCWFSFGEFGKDDYSLQIYNSVDVYNLVMLQDWNVEIIEGIFFEGWSGRVAEFFHQFFKLKCEAEQKKDANLRHFAKIILNSTYGKFYERKGGQISFDDDLVPTMNFNASELPVDLGSICLSMSRMLNASTQIFLRDFFARYYPNYTFRFVYTDTDSFYIHFPPWLDLSIELLKTRLFSKHVSSNGISYEFIENHLSEFNEEVGLFTKIGITLENLFKSDSVENYAAHRMIVFGKKCYALKNDKLNKFKVCAKGQLVSQLTYEKMVHLFKTTISNGFIFNSETFLKTIGVKATKRKSLQVSMPTEAQFQVNPHLSKLIRTMHIKNVEIERSISISIPWYYAAFSSEINSDTFTFKEYLTHLIEQIKNPNHYSHKQLCFSYPSIAVF